MGFSFRKSIKIAPGLRVNVSTRGVGLSAGVRGARVSVGPRGIHAYGGIGPLRYQKKLDAKINKDISNGTIPAVNETVEEFDSGLSGNPLYFLIPPTNWWAWLAFVGTCFTFGLLAPIWIFTLIKGPKKLMTYRRWIKNKQQIEALAAKERIEHFRNFNSDYPSDFFRVRLTRALYESGQYEEALPHLQYFCQLYPTAAFSLPCGECHHRLKQWDEALACFAYCDEQDEFEGFLTVLHLKAESYIGKREYDMALECIDSGLRKRGEQHVEGKRKLKLTRAKTYIAMGDSNKAKKEIEKLLKEVPDFEEAQLLLASLRPAA